MKIRILTFLILVLFVLSGCGSTDHANHSNDEEKHVKNNGNEENHQSHEESKPTITSSVSFQFDEVAQSGKDNKLNIQVSDESGNPIKEFKLEHEKLMHLIVVSEDLTYFDHIHPEYQGEGKFTVMSTFPTGGAYKLYADYVPKGFSKVVKSEMIQVEGNMRTETPLKEGALTQVIDSNEVKLTFDHLMAGMQTELNFNFQDVEKNEPIIDLQPYLGAVGHVVIISADTNTYLHVHPVEEKATGPEATFMTTFPEPGIYKIWGQFKRDDHVFTVPFTVNVPLN